MSRASQSFAMTARYRHAARPTKRKAHLHGTIISHHPAIVSLFAPVNAQKFHDITAQHAVDEKEDSLFGQPPGMRDFRTIQFPGWITDGPTMPAMPADEANRTREALRPAGSI